MKFYEWTQGLQGGHTMTPKEFEVAVITASYCTGETGEDIRPGAALIAQGVNWKNPHRIYKTLKSVVQKGYLEVVDPGGKGRASRYRLSLPDPHRIDTHRSGEGHRSGTDQSGGTPSPDRGDYLATYTYSSLDEEKEEEDSQEVLNKETGELTSVDSADDRSAWWDRRISSAWDDPKQLEKVGKALVAELPEHPLLDGMRARVADLRKSSAQKSSPASTSPTNPYDSAAWSEPAPIPSFARRP